MFRILDTFALMLQHGGCSEVCSSRNRNRKHFFVTTHHSLQLGTARPPLAQVSFYLAEFNGSTTRALRETIGNGNRLRLRSGSTASLRLRRRGRHRLPNTTYGRPPDTGGCFLQQEVQSDARITLCVGGRGRPVSAETAAGRTRLSKNLKIYMCPGTNKVQAFTPRAPGGPCD